MYMYIYKFIYLLIFIYSIHHLQKVQNTAARIVTRSVHSSHNSPVFKSLHWLPINFYINFKICCITHRELSLHEPHYFSSLFNFNLILIPFVLPLLVHYYYLISIKNHMVFVHFHTLHLISGITYLIIFVLHQSICR